MTDNLPALAGTEAKVPQYRISTMTPQQAVDSLNEAETVIYNELRDLYSGKLEKDLWEYWNIGKRVAAIHRDAQKQKKVYGEHLLERLAIALGGKSSSSLLRQMMRVVEIWPNKQAFGDIVKLRGSRENILSWSHIVHLASVTKEDMRLQLATSALEEGWNSKELFAKIQSWVTDRRRGYGGRPPAVPGSVAACVTHMLTAAGKFIKLYDQSWTGEAFDLLEKVKELPPDKLTDELLKDIDEARMQMAELDARVEETQELLKKAEQQVVRRKQNAGPPPEEEEEAEAEEYVDADDIKTDEINMGEWKHAQDVANKPKKKLKGRVGVK